MIGGNFWFFVPFYWPINFYGVREVMGEREREREREMCTHTHTPQSQVVSKVYVRVPFTLCYMKSTSGRLGDREETDVYAGGHCTAIE